MKKPKLNFRYRNGEIDDDLPWVGVIDVDPETGHLYDEEGDVLDDASLDALCAGDGRGEDE